LWKAGAARILGRYFDIQAKWDSRKYSLVTVDDMIFQHQAAKRFNGEISNLLKSNFVGDL
jgi:hypothetical protein